MFGGFTHLMDLELLLIMDKVNFNGDHPHIEMEWGEVHDSLSQIHFVCNCDAANRCSDTSSQ